jgi:hypothetical protein
MKLNPYLVRGYVLLAIDICRLAGWIYVVANLITNYLSEVEFPRFRGQLRAYGLQPLTGAPFVVDG